MLRDKKALNQDGLAKAIGVTKNSIYNYENDKRLPGADVLVAMADYFDVSTDYLLGRTLFESEMVCKNYIEQADTLVSVLGETVVGNRRDIVENLIRVVSSIQNDETDVDTLSVLLGLYAQMIECRNECISIANETPIQYDAGRTTAISQQEFSVHLNKIIVNRDAMTNLILLTSIIRLHEVHSRSHKGGYEMERIARDTLDQYISSGWEDAGERLCSLLSKIDVKMKKG